MGGNRKENEHELELGGSPTEEIDAIITETMRTYMMYSSIGRAVLNSTLQNVSSMSGAFTLEL